MKHIFRFKNVFHNDNVENTLLIKLQLNPTRSVEILKRFSENSFEPFALIAQTSRSSKRIAKRLTRDPIGLG